MKLRGRIEIRCDPDVERIVQVHRGHPTQRSYVEAAVRTYDGTGGPVSREEFTALLARVEALERLFREGAP